MSSAFVTVIVLSYNRPKGLKNTLEAILAQSHQDLEIIIGDDCSTDPEVAKVISAYQKQDHRIQTFIQPQNLGIVQHQKWLIEKVSRSSQFVMWACDDDGWHKDYIKVCVEALQKNPEAIVCATDVRFKTEKGLQDAYPFENVHTLGIQEAPKRYVQVLRNTLWWNHVFYGLIRKEVYDTISLRQQFAFDISFVLELSLMGEFIKLPNRFFYKSFNGNGSNIQANLKAIKVRNKLAERSPRMAAANAFIRNIWRQKQLSLKEKFQLSKGVIREVQQKEMYPIPQDALWRKIVKFPTYRKEVRTYLRDYAHIPDESIIKRLYELQIPVTEVSQSTTNPNKIRLHKLGVEVDWNSTLVTDYYDLVQLRTTCDIAFFQENTDAPVLATYKDYKFYLKEGYYGFLVREILVRETYGIRLTEDSVLFDVGNNVGLTALYFAYQDKIKKVYGFEPFEETANEAKANYELNPAVKEKVELFQYGLYDKEATKLVPFSFTASQFANTSSNTQQIANKTAMDMVQIQLKTASEVLQPLLQKHPNEQKILKVDCEGDEYRIFENLDDNRLLQLFDYILLEWHENGDQTLIEILHKNGFRVISSDKVYSEQYGTTGMIYAIKNEPYGV